jgi:hypothetical protein
MYLRWGAWLVFEEEVAPDAWDVRPGLALKKVLILRGQSEHRAAAGRHGRALDDGCAACCWADG